MGKELVEIKCTNCGKSSMKRKDNVNATLRRSGNLFCSQRCVLLHRNGAASISERLAARSKKNAFTGCIEWTGYAIDGYGSLRIDGRQALAHRVSYIESVGPIAPGLCVCHRCDNRRCINPAHLFLGTNRDNIDDMISKGRQRRPCGEKNPRSKITETQAKEILFSTSPAKTAAKSYGLSPGSIRQIRRGDTWRHLQPSR